MALVTLVGAQREPLPPSIDLVELDVAVLDGHDQPVTGLHISDFTVKEDGRPADIKTFAAVTSNSTDPDDVRSVVLLMDDPAVPAAGNQAMQTIARAFVQSAAPRDDVSVVRLHNRSDEPFGDRRVAEFPIARSEERRVGKECRL